jgi:hypothetical protein
MLDVPLYNVQVRWDGTARHVDKKRSSSFCFDTTLAIHRTTYFMPNRQHRIYNLKSPAMNYLRYSKHLPPLSQTQDPTVHQGSSFVTDHIEVEGHWIVS